MKIEGYLKESYPGIVLRKIRLRRKAEKSNNMLEAMRKYRECTCKKPERQIRHEISLCRSYWGCFPLHYFKYGLYRNDMPLSREDLLDYIPEFFFYSLFLPFYDSDDYKTLLEDKNVMEGVFRSAGIAQPQTLFKLVDNSIYTADYHRLGFKDIEGSLHELPHGKIFVKPVSGSGGYGIYIFHRSENGYFDKNGESFDEKFIKRIGTQNDYIVQPGLSQNENISLIYPNSINTFRIVTENIGGNTRIICSVLRIGRNMNEFDNASQGGIILKIGLDSGKAGDTGFTELNQLFGSHPDSGYIFKDFKFNEWDIVKRFVRECASRLPQFTYLGWDIASTLNGPVAIEANLSFGLDLLQLPNGGLRKAFGIDSPGFYYKNRGKRL